MPCSRLRHRGFKHCQGLGRGLPCKRCMLGNMTIPELLNHSDWCRATQPYHNNCRAQRSKNCEIYRRECIRSFSDDDPERFETPNDAHDDDYECAEVENVFVRECAYPPPCKSPSPPPCQTPPPHESQTPLPTEKPPPCKTSPVADSTYPSTIIQCDDSYIEIPCPNFNPADQYNSDGVCKKPSLCPAPSLCKALSSSQIPFPCATMSSLECQSVVICDPDENKIGRRVSFGSVSELQIPPCQQERRRVVEPVSIIEISPNAVESTEIYPKQSFATQNDVSPNYSVESQSDLSVCKKGSTVSMEMHALTSSESSITCGAKDCPKSATAKSKHCTHSKVKQEKEKKAIKSCGAKDCPKSTSPINSFPCVSPSPSKTKFECPKHKKKETNESPSDLTQSPPLTTSASNEMRSQSLSSNSDVTCSHKNEKESQSKCNVHKKSNKRSWFRKCKAKTPRKKQQNQKENKSTHGEHCQCHFIPEEQGMQHVDFTLSEQEKPRVIAPNRQPVHGESEINAQDPACSDKQFVQGYIPQGQNMYSQLPQADRIPHGQLFTYEQPPGRTLLDLSTSKIETPRGQLASSTQIGPEVTSQAVQTPTSHFGPRGQIPQSQLASGIQTHPGMFSQSPELPLSSFFAPREQMPQSQFISKMQTPPSLFSQAVETPRRQFYSQDQSQTQQNLQGQLLSGGQFPQNQFTSGGQIPQGQFAPSGQTPQVEFPGGYYPRNQYTPDEQNLLGQFNPGQIARRQFVSGEQYPRSQFAQIPHSEFVSQEHMPLSNFMPGGQNGQFTLGQRPQSEFVAAGHIPQRHVIPGGRNLPNRFVSKQIPQSQFASAEQFNPFEQVQQGGFVPGVIQNQYIPNDQTLSSHFVLDRKFGEAFTKEQIVPSQFTAGGQNTQCHCQLGEILKSQFGVIAPQNQFTTRPFHSGGGSSQYSPDNFPPGKLLPRKPVHLQKEAQYYPGEPGQFAPNGSIPQTQSVSGQISSEQMPSGGQMVSSELVSGRAIPTRISLLRGQVPSNQCTSTELPQDQIGPQGSNRQEEASQARVPLDQYVLGSLDKADHSLPRDQNEYGMIHNPQVSDQTPRAEMPHQFQEQFQKHSREQSVSGTQRPHTQVPSGGQMFPSQLGSGSANPTRTSFPGGQVPSKQYTPSELPQDQIGPHGSNRQEEASQARVPLDQYVLGSLDKADHGVPRDQNWYGMIHNPQVSGQTPPAEMPQQFQEQFQKHSKEQSVSGTQRPYTQLPSGGQMFPNQLDSGNPIPTRTSFSGGQVPSKQYNPTELPQDQIGPQGSNRQEEASQARVPLDQYVFGSLDKVDHGVPRDQNEYGMILNPHVSGQTPPAEMPQQFQEQFQKHSREQSVSGAQRPPTQVPSGDQMFLRQSASGSPIPTKTSFSGGQIPFNQYTPAELPQDQISAEVLNRQQLSSQIGTPPDQFDLKNVDNANQGAPRDQNWHGIICPPVICGSKGKVTTNISPCSSSKTLCNCIKISCNCLTRECRGKFKCTCCYNNNEAPKYCQHACVQCTEGRRISPTKSFSGYQNPSNPNSSARTPSGLFGSEGSGRNDQGIESGKPSDQSGLEYLDKKETCRIFIPCRNADGNLCKCTDITCSCPISDKSDKNTSKQTWCLQNVIINTSLHKFQHPNTAPVANTPEVNNNLSVIPKRNAYCECHYPPMFRHFQCTGNSCGICKCREAQHE
ncbi:uncharacterized protein LOC113226102 [Hyposmocoma kahamanoa]|uniref:uncharacterized protein LOC113226102 n=1 Tax=Hyposmocoma kahamanoa TaxID=1477025 RepID=UPI000E6DA37C|nr:uncharacterized protein LOC113226102 [Hyposmocoma kahamanoa]XP_026314407.1 uncharacterized protein LOC113226102 [Hyposmocoma kahamanoa]XP_026314408.1 uncharacterized protein LOC113226102 [Hyposmocoma kahamanoa]